jgi:mRNA interferase MazF
MIHRGEIHFVDLDQGMGREQRGYRPVLVVSADAINAQPLVVTIVVGTDGEHVPRDYPVNVRVSSQDTGLPRETVFLCLQVRSLDSSRFKTQPAGRMPEDKMAEVDTALRLVLGL